MDLSKLYKMVPGVGLGVAEKAAFIQCWKKSALIELL